MCFSRSHVESMAEISNAGLSKALFLGQQVYENFHVWGWNEPPFILALNSTVACAERKLRGTTTCNGGRLDNRNGKGLQPSHEKTYV